MKKAADAVNVPGTLAEVESGKAGGKEDDSEVDVDMNIDL